MRKLILIAGAVASLLVISPREASAHCHGDAIPCDVLTTAFLAFATVFAAADLTSKALGHDGLITYLRSNRTALAADLTLGAGPTIDDLAYRFGVQDVGDFGRKLRRERDRLMMLSSDSVLKRRGARPFIGHVHAVLSR